MSGHEQGVAHLFFKADGTLSGRAVYTFSGRTTGIFTNGGVLSTNIFGSAHLVGQWSYASPTSTNRIVGFINGISTLAGTTTLVTNSLSFRGGLTASKLDLLSMGYQGQVTFRGIPLRATNNLSGTYYGTGKKQGAPAPFVEVFDLTPAPEFELLTNSITTSFDCSVTNITIFTNSFSTTNLNSIINVTNYFNYVTITQQVCVVENTIYVTFVNESPANYYQITGGGPGYEYTGRFLVSRQRYAALFQSRGSRNEFINVYAGSFNFATGRGSLVGTDGVSRNIKFEVAHGP